MSGRTYNGRTYDELVRFLGKQGADNYISWFTPTGGMKASRWNNNEGRYEPDPDDH